MAAAWTLVVCEGDAKLRFPNSDREASLERCRQRGTVTAQRKVPDRIRRTTPPRGEFSCPLAHAGSGTVSPNHAHRPKPP
jgi:hypothetical protein